jgi:hypothetical protein
MKKLKMIKSVYRCMQWAKQIRNYFKKGDDMKKLLALLTACMLVTSLSFASIGDRVNVSDGGGVKFDSININNGVPSGGVTTAATPFANVFKLIGPNESDEQLTNNQILSFNRFRTSDDSVFGFENGQLVCKQNGLYVISNFMEIQHRQRAPGIAGLYVTANGTPIPGSPALLTLFRDVVGSLDNSFTLVVKNAPVTLNFVFTFSGAGQFFRGPPPAQLGFGNPIKSTPYAPFTANAFFIRKLLGDE